MIAPIAGDWPFTDCVIAGKNSLNPNVVHY